MKKSIIYGLFVAALSFSAVSCDDFLDDNRYPLDKQTDSPDYWNNPVNVQAQLNAMYGYYTGYGNGTSWVNNFYYRALSDDQCYEIVSGGMQFTQWAYQYAPETNGSWDDTYAVIRKCNTVIKNVEASSLSEVEKANYSAIARLNRAYQYWDLVRRFGDVILVTEILDVNSEQLYVARDDRNVVMDFVLEDLNYAVANISQESNKIEFSKDMANAMKSQICLYEASYAKYHQNNKERADKYYAEVVEAAEALMGKYTVCDNYQSLYNSVWTADASRGFLSLRDNPEVIFMKGYDKGVMSHSMIKYLSSNTPISGMTKDAFDAYLFKDGKPKSKTSCNTSDAAVVVDGKLSIEAALAERDGRLAQTIDPYLAYDGNSVMSYDINGNACTDPLASVTGYTIKKFTNPGMTYDESTLDGQNFTNAPVYWLAVVLLDYAEAKAELGTLDDNDINNTLNKLYARAGLPAQTKASLESMNDDANNMGVSSLLWEIRRCRRCELMFDNWNRYWDLVRWHQLHLLDTNNYPNIARGANVSNGTADMNAAIAVDGNGYIDCSRGGTSVRTFTEREYLYPLGTTEITLNPALGQNPGW